MSRSHLTSCIAAVVLAACAAHKTSRAPAPVAAAKTAAPTTANPSGKSHAEKKHTSAAAEKNTTLLPREVGYYLDVLQGRLQQRLDPGVIIGRERDSIVLDFSRRLSFMPDAAQLDEIARSLLLPLAKVLDEYRSVLVSVRVSADDDAIAARKLAQQRALVIARGLTDGGVAAARVVAEAPSTAAHDGNAHVEIVLAPETRGN